MNCIFSQQSTCSDPQSKHLRMQLYQTIPSRHATVRHYTYKNFFETILPRTVQDHSELLSSLIIELVNFEDLSSNLKHLLSYLNQRYPGIKIPQRQNNSQDKTITTSLIFQRENSKTSIHNILNLFDPNVRPKVIPPSPSSIPTVKKPITFKRLGTKITTLAAFSRMTVGKKPMSFNVKNVHT